MLVLADGATDEVFSNLNISDLAEIENLPDVVRRNGRPLASRETYLIVNQPLPTAQRAAAKRRFLQLRGIDDPQLTAARPRPRTVAGRAVGSPRPACRQPRPRARLGTPPRR